MSKCSATYSDTQHVCNELIYAPVHLTRDSLVTERELARCKVFICWEIINLLPHAGIATSAELCNVVQAKAQADPHAVQPYPSVTSVAIQSVWCGTFAQSNLAGFPSFSMDKHLWLKVLQMESQKLGASAVAVQRSSHAVSTAPARQPKGSVSLKLTQANNGCTEPMLMH